MEEKIWGGKKKGNLQGLKGRPGKIQAGRLLVLISGGKEPGKSLRARTGPARSGTGSIRALRLRQRNPKKIRGGCRLQKLHLMKRPGGPQTGEGRAGFHPGMYQLKTLEGEEHHIISDAWNRNATPGKGGERKIARGGSQVYETNPRASWFGKRRGDGPKGNYVSLRSKTEKTFKKKGRSQVTGKKRPSGGTRCCKVSRTRQE